jgi:DUF4097 and DUF4098 domain-containing protein YvlB
MNVNKSLIQFAILLLAAGLPAPAQVHRGEPQKQGRAWVEVDEATSPAREGGKLIVRVDSGSVAVKAGSPNQVQCRVYLRAYTDNEARAREFFGDFKLTVRPQDDGGVYIEGKGGESGRRHGTEYEVAVPERFNVDVETQGGDIHLDSNLQGEFRATTAGGDIRTMNVGGPVHVETAGGGISLGDIGSHVEAQTAGGSIRVGTVKGDEVLETSGGQISTGQVNGNLRAETAGGDLMLAGATGQIRAATAGGQIQIGETGGGVRAETAGGTIRLQGARGNVVVETAGGAIELYRLLASVHATTAAGPIMAQIIAGPKTFAASQLETASGDVRVFLPVDLPLNIDAEIEDAGGHKIISDFPLTIRGEGDGFSSHNVSARGSVNGGGDMLRIRTTSGTIEIHKLDAQATNLLNQRQAEEVRKMQEKQAAHDLRQAEKRRREKPDDNN